MIRTFGIWRSAESLEGSGWWLTKDGVIFHTPFEGVAKAQCLTLNQSEPRGWFVRLIGARGQPLSTYRVEAASRAKIVPRKDERGTEYDHG